MKEKAEKNKKIKVKSTVKKPLSAYMFFAKAMRQKIKEELGDVSFADMGRELGRRWQSLDESGREKYVREADADKQRYESAKEK